MIENQPMRSREKLNQQLFQLTTWHCQLIIVDSINKFNRSQQLNQNIGDDDRNTISSFYVVQKVYFCK